jgi:hypothetical protein
VKVDIEAIDALKVLARPFISDPTSVKDPVRDLKSEVCSTRFEAEPMVPLKALVSPLASEPDRVREEDRDMNREVCSPKLEVAPKEPDRALKSDDLSTKLDTKDNELERDLNREFFSARLEAEPKEPVRVTLRAFITELERPNEPDSDLKREVCSA